LFPDTAAFVVNLKHVISRRVGRDGILEPGSVDADRFRFYRSLFQHRFVRVVAVLFLRQNRDVGPLDQVELQFLRRDFLQRAINGDELDAMRAIFREVIERRIGLVADHARQGRDEERIVGVHAATAFGFEALSREGHLVGRIGKALKIQRDRRLAVGVSRLIAQVDRLPGPLFFSFPQWIVKGIALEFVEGKIAWREFELTRNASIARRGAVEIAQRDKRLYLLRIDPAARRFLRQARLDLHPIGQEFFDAKIAGAEEGVALPVTQQVNFEAVGAGWRFVRRWEIQLCKSHRGQAQLAHLRPETARVQNFHFDRHSFELPLPGALFHDATDVHFVARPIHAALGKNEGLELIA